MKKRMLSHDALEQQRRERIVAIIGFVLVLAAFAAAAMLAAPVEHRAGASPAGFHVVAHA